MHIDLPRCFSRLAIFATFAVALVGCKHGTLVSAGAPSMDALIRITDSILLENKDSTEMEKYVDMTGVPEAIARILKDGHGGIVRPGPGLVYTGKRLLSPNQIEQFEREQDAGLPEYMQGHPPTVSPKWNIVPERLIIYCYEQKDEFGHRWPMWFTFGAFRKNDGWHFAVDYSVLESLMSTTSEVPNPALLPSSAFVTPAAEQPASHR